MKKRHTYTQAKNKRIFLISAVAVLLIIAILAVILRCYGVISFIPGLNRGGTQSEVSSAVKTETSGDAESSEQDSSDTKSSDSASSEEDLPSMPVEIENFYTANERIYYKGENIAYGIDVSAYQGTIDWDAAAADGITFAMLRAGFRGYGKPNIVTDTMFEENLSGAVAAGLDVGVYFFSQAISEEEAREEADFVCSLIHDKKVTYPVVIDWERVTEEGSRTKDITGADVTRFVSAFCDRIKEQGFTPGFYFNPTDSSSEINADALADYFFWMAEYNAETPNIEYSFTMWQYSNTGEVAGIDGCVDLNIFFGNYDKGKK